MDGAGTVAARMMSVTGIHPYAGAGYLPAGMVGSVAGTGAVLTAGMVGSVAGPGAVLTAGMMACAAGTGVAGANAGFISGLRTVRTNSVAAAGITVRTRAGTYVAVAVRSCAAGVVAAAGTHAVIIAMVGAVILATVIAGAEGMGSPAAAA